MKRSYRRPQAQIKCRLVGIRLCVIYRTPTILSRKACRRCRFTRICNITPRRSRNQIIFGVVTTADLAARPRHRHIISKCIIGKTQVKSQFKLPRQVATVVNSENWHGFFSTFDPISVLASLAFLAFLLQSFASLYDRSRSMLPTIVSSRQQSAMDLTIPEISRHVSRALRDYVSSMCPACSDNGASGLKSTTIVKITDICTAFSGKSQ